MDIFSGSDYYPTPSSNVVRYRESDGSKAKRSVLNAELVALITDLSSPIEAVDYTVISDFFLVYRNFLNPVQLEEILILRFRWCIAETMANEQARMKRRRIGEIALVRTFVLLRHWILNYFVQDFLVDVNLRLRFINFLNLELSGLPRIVQCTILNLKKSWIHYTKKVWTNLELDEPKSIGEDDLWVLFEIKDFTELNELKKRDSRLSAYAIQSSSSPTFRNRSVLSLYKSSDIFQLPVPSPIARRKRSKRTASMVLFPQDTSNVDSRVPDITGIANRNSQFSNKITLAKHNAINRLSKLTLVSTAMKDIKYPRTPGIDKVIPPTPAKKVELILQLPEDNIEDERISNRKDQDYNDVSRPSSWNKMVTMNRTVKGRISRLSSTSSSNFRNSAIHHGAMGLLNKWRKNHAYFKINNSVDLDSWSSSSQVEKIHEANNKKEMDNFVKYVISISSLEDRNLGVSEMENLVSTKFDLLSARTIEEVEYLVTLENDLIRELQETPERNAEGPSIVKRTMEEEDNEGTEDVTPFSAMDNLNLYQTVNSIANSVFSLSKSLTQYKQQQQQNQDYKASPSLAALERYKAQNVLPLMKNAQSVFGLPNQTTIKGEDSRLNQAPQRLIFHDSSLSNGSSKMNGLSILRPETDHVSAILTPTKTQNFQSPDPNSPSRGVLPNLEEQRESSQYDHNNDRYSTSSYMSYDSGLFDTLHDRLYSTIRRSNQLPVSPGEVSTLKKDARPHLEEFSFENGNKIYQEDSGREDSEREESQSLSSFVTTNTTNYETMSDGENNVIDNHDGNDSSIYSVQSSSIHGKEGYKKGRHKEGNPEEEFGYGAECECTDKEENQFKDDYQGSKGPADEFRNERPPDISVRPASGRVSLAKRRTDVSFNPRESAWSAAQQRVVEDPYYLNKDKELREKEKELLEIERNVRNRMSTATSVDTAMLFSSVNGSPRRCTGLDSDNFHLSTTPTIRSVSNGRPDSGSGTSETYGESIRVPTTSASSTNPWDLPRVNNLRMQESADSSFNYSPVASENDIGGAAGNMPGRYLFTPENEDVDYASPDKNVEALKNRFFEDDNASHDNSSKLDEDTPLKNKEDPKNSGREHGENTSNIDALLKTIGSTTEDTPRTSYSPESLDWNTTQDSEVDDPVNVALMKLEGTYRRGKNKVKQGSEEDIPQEETSSSALSREVNMLGISDVDGRLRDSGNKRKSLLIEARRRSVMNVPYTPTKAAKPLENPKQVALQVKDLINLYEIKDPSLLVANCQQHIPFILMYDSLSIAQQMTLIEKELLSEVDWKDLLDVNITYSGPSVTSWLQLLVQNESLSGIDLAIARFNLTVDWIISEVILTSDIRLKRNTIQRFIHVADHCRSFQNYNTLMEIVLALNSAAVQKYIEAWRLIEPGDLITWGELKKMPSLDRNYCYIRKLLNNIDPIKGCVPFIVVYLSDLSLNNEKRTWIKENEVVNYNKFETNVQIVKNFIQRVQWSKFYNFREDHELLSKCVYLTALSQDEITQVINNLNKTK